MDLEIGRAWGEGQWMPTAGLKPWPEVEQSDFYQWFGWHEVGRTDHGDGRVAIHLKPGGHQDSIDLAVALDAQQSVRLASLTMERSWMDGGLTAKAADDLAQSFLLAFAQRHPEGDALAKAIFVLERGSQPFLRAADPTPGPPSAPSGIVKAGLDAYLNVGQAVELMGPDVTILLDNWRGMAASNRGTHLMIEVLAALPPRPSFMGSAPVLVTTYPETTAGPERAGTPDPPEPPTPVPFPSPFPAAPLPDPPPPPYQPPVSPPAPPPPGPPTPPRPFPALAPDASPAGRQHDALYLQASDLPAGMSVTQDSRDRGADPGDTAFAQHGGLHAGGAVWQGPETAPIARLVDIRWVFPTAQASTAYHHQTMRVNSEGTAEVVGAPKVGTDCHVFGGSFDPLGMGAITSYFYLFTVGPVVVKLYAADFDGRRLRPEHLTPIAERIARRVSAAQGASVAPPRKPWWRFW